MDITLDELTSRIKNSWKLAIVAILLLLALAWLWGFLTQGTLKITVAPAPATLLIDQSRSTIEATSEMGVSPGEHKVTVKKDGYLDYSVTVTIRSREKTELSINLLNEPDQLANSARYPKILPDNKTIYFLGADSRLYQVGTDSGVPQLLRDLILPNPLNIVWSNDGSSMLLAIPNIKFQLSQSKSPFYSPADSDNIPIAWIYDVGSGRLNKLSANVISFAWSADGRSIFYVPFTSPASIYTANADGSGARKLVDIKFPNITLSPSPDSRYLAWFNQPEGFGSSNVSLIELGTGVQRDLTDDGYSTGATWSPDSKWLLITKFSSNDLSSSVILIEISSVQQSNLADRGVAEGATWIPDGSKFYTYDAESRVLIEVTPGSKQTGEILSTDKGAPRDLAISGDGKSLIYVLEGALYLINLN